MKSSQVSITHDTRKLKNFRVELDFVMILIQFFNSSWVYLTRHLDPCLIMRTSHPIQFWPRNKWIFVLSRQTARDFKRTWLKGRALFHNFCFSDFCLFLLPYDYPLLTVKFSYFSDQDWDSRYWTDDCRDVPYQAQSLYTTLRHLH